MFRSSDLFLSKVECRVAVVYNVSAWQPGLLLQALWNSLRRHLAFLPTSFSIQKLDAEQLLCLRIKGENSGNSKCLYQCVTLNPGFGGDHSSINPTLNLPRTTEPAPSWLLPPTLAGCCCGPLSQSLALLRLRILICKWRLLRSFSSIFWGHKML